MATAMESIGTERLAVQSSSPPSSDGVDQKPAVMGDGISAASASSSTAVTSPTHSVSEEQQQPAISGFGKLAPLNDVSIFSRYTFTWVTPLVMWGHNHILSMGDIFRLPDQLNPQQALEQFDVHWRVEVARKGHEQASFARCLLRTYRKPFAIAIFYVTAHVAFAVAGSAYFLRQLLVYAGTPSAEADPAWGAGMALGLILCEMMRSTLIHAWWFAACSLASNYRSIVYALVYTKAMRLRDLAGYSIGELVNICSNDGQRIYDAGSYFPFVYVASLTLTAVLIFSSLIFGPAAILGCFVFLLLFPMQAAVASVTGRLRKKTMQHTDRRVRLMNEILACVKLIKMYAWELPFSRQIGAIRQKEKKLLTRAGYLQSYSYSIVPVASVLAAVSTAMLHVYTGNPLPPADMFSVLALFNVLRFSFAVLPMGVKAGAEAS
eukprot:UC1_evm1s1238